MRLIRAPDGVVGSWREGTVAAMVLAHGGQWGWDAWAWLVIPVTVYFLITGVLLALGRTGDTDNVLTFVFAQIADSLKRATGFPGWAMAGVLSGLMALLLAVIGLYWDVAWHIDYGRDVELFTPSHVMILAGLGGLVYAAVLAVLFASLEGAEVGVRAGRLRVPYSAVVLVTFGFGALIAFPLDDLWHKTYGIDVTLWSPTHLQLVAGGSLATIALFLMCAEALPHAHPNWLGRSIYILTGGTILVGLSTFQGEFDFGVPQFQVLYLPLLIMVAAGFTLVLGRLALGPWGALKFALVYLILRVVISLVVGGALHHTVPRFALYLPSALAVEAVAWRLGTSRRLMLAVGGGLLVGTLGLAGELAWVAATSPLSTPAPLALMVKIVLLAPVAAVAASVLGAGLARGFSRHGDRVPIAALVTAGLVLVAVLAYPLPRRVGEVSAVVRLEPVGDRAIVEVDLAPPDAARGATAFAVSSWQGGGRLTAALEEVNPGRYRSVRPVPVSGRWKSTIHLMRGDEVMAAPVYLPADPEIGASAVPALPQRQVSFVQVTKLLMREAHGGPAWPAVAAYTGLTSLLGIWIALVAMTARRLDAAEPVDGDGQVPGDHAHVQRVAWAAGSG